MTALTANWEQVKAQHENPGLIAQQPLFGQQKVWFEYLWQPTGKLNADGSEQKIQKEITWIQAPGADKTAQATTDEHRYHWSTKPIYDAWKNGLPIPVTGTPLSEWSAMPRAVCESLIQMGFETLEQLAEGTEMVRAKLGPLMSWSKKAQDALKAKDSNPAKLAAALTELDREKEKIARLEDQIAKMQARIEVSGV